MAGIRIAVIGTGLIGRRHVELVRASPQAQLVAVADPDPVALEEVRGDARGYRDLDALLADGGVDAVIVATPNALHVPQALACVAAGVPVLVEKPVADSVDEATRLAAATAASGVPVLVGHHRRHSPTLRRAREVVASGQLGDLVAVAGTAVYYKPDRYFDEGPWRRTAGGGPILINMVHEVDDLRMLCGDIVGVTAVGSNATRGFAVEDTVAMTLRFASGALGTFLLSDAAAAVRSWENLSGEDPAFPRYADEDCYLLSGTRGSLEVPTLRLRTIDGEASWWRRMPEQRLEASDGDPLELQLAHFCAVVRGEARPEVTVEDALETLRVTLQLADAVRDGMTG